MSQPYWITPAGSLGTIPEGIFYAIPLAAQDPTTSLVPTAVRPTGGIATFQFALRWSTTANYQVGNVVNYSGLDFVCLLANSGQAPGINTFWAPFTINGVQLKQSSIVFPLNTTVVLAGFAPAEYNGTYTVIRTSATSIGISNSATDPVTVFGTITNVPANITYEVIAGQLPAGIAIDENGIIGGVPGSTIGGVPADVAVDTTSRFAVRARNGSSLADRTFSITVSVLNQPYFVTPAGSIGEFIAGDQIVDLQIETYNPDIYGEKIVRLVSGALPPGLTISTNGIISGVVQSPIATGATPTGFDSSITQIGSVATVGVDPQATLDADFPLAGFNDGVVDTTTGNLWVQTGRNDLQFSSVWNNYGLVSEVLFNQPFDWLGFDAASATTALVATFQFTLEVTNGQNSDLRTFDLIIYARSAMSADTDVISTDNTYITADVYNLTSPVLTTPAGSIGSVRAGNYFAFQFTGENVDGNPFTFVSDDLPPGLGLSLDPNSGWLYGSIPDDGITITTYDFTVQVVDDLDPGLFSAPYTYSLTVIGSLLATIVWNTPGNLGTIANGATSTLYVQATSVEGFVLEYQLAGLETGDDPVYNLLPQGLELLPSGHIVGRVSFNTFALDGGTTTFDRRTTTFDLTFTFTVQVTSANGLVNELQTFTITVIRVYEEPYDNLYIQAMPPLDDRALLNSLLQDDQIFPPDLIYRSDDLNFGVARRVVYNHAYGLTAVILDDYINSLDLNHYWKNLVLGEIKTAQARDDLGNVIYEVVYSEVVDDLVNNSGESVGKSVNLPYVVESEIGLTQTVYPNSLDNMRDQVIDTVGQTSAMLPRWMLSKQSDGSVLGFTPAWVIAYTVPDQSGQVAYNIQSQFGINKLNLVDFEVDRYELDNLLTKNWSRADQHWQVVEAPVITITDITSTGSTVAISFDSQIPTLATAWAITNSYLIEDIVDYDGNLYQAIQTVPAVLSIAITDTAYWQPIVPFTSERVQLRNVIPSSYNGIYTVVSCTTTEVVIISTNTDAYPSVSVWSPTTAYNADDQVTYFSTRFVCLVANTGEYPLPINPDPNSAGIPPPNPPSQYWLAVPNPTVSGGYTSLNPTATTFDFSLLQTSWINSLDPAIILPWVDDGGGVVGWSYGTLDPVVLGDQTTDSGTPNTTGLSGTTFDGGSLQFTAPVDMYSNTTEYDKYLVFPKRTILG